MEQSVSRLHTFHISTTSQTGIQFLLEARPLQSGYTIALPRKNTPSSA
jgi:hypothetical protein